MALRDLTDDDVGFTNFSTPPKPGAIVQAKQINERFLIVTNQDRPELGEIGDYLIRIDNLNFIMKKETFESRFQPGDGG